MENLQGGMLALEHYYEINSIQDRGTFGSRYKATQKPLARPVSLWVMESLSEMGASAQLLERIKRATWRASRISHPNHLRIIDYGQLESRVPFLVTEEAPEHTLQSLIATEGSLSPVRTLKFLEQIAAALDESYRQHIFHGALDASCVLVFEPGTPREHVKLSGHGLGLSRLDLFALDQAMFTTHLVRHLPPEAFDNSLDTERKASATLEEEDGRETYAEDADDFSAEYKLQLDVYGMGSIAYECLSGMHPYFREDRDASDGILSMLREEPPRLGRYFNLPDEMDSVIHQALARIPEERHTDPSKFVEALRGAMPEVLLNASPFDPLESPEDPPYRPLVEWLAALGELTPHRVKEFGKRPGVRRAITTLLVLCNIISVAALLHVSTQQTGPPEITFPIPNAPGEGIDLMIMAPKDQLKAELHIVSREGETALLGTLPFLLRDQKPGNRISFVLMGSGPPEQLEVLVRDEGQQWMSIDTERWRSGRQSTARLTPTPQ